MNVKTAAQALESVDWEKVGRVAALGDAVQKYRDTPERWPFIRKLYAECMPDILAAGKDRGIDPYFTDWVRLFTPIELDAWNSIRSHGVPLYPQFPALNYFIDFANPVRRIGLELDGAKFHSLDKDWERDRRLFDEGWTIFRIPGRQTKVRFDDPFDDYDDDDATERKAHHWLMNTSDGVIFAIREVYFSRKPGRWRDWAMKSLETHCLVKAGLYMED